MYVKKFMLANLFIILCLFFTLYNSNFEKSSDDFNFLLLYGYNGDNSINTFNNRLTKDLVINGNQTIKFKMPKEKKDEIYQLIIKNKINELPETIESKGFICYPSNKLYLKYSINGETKTVSWDTAFWREDERLDDNQNCFLNFVKQITDYIHNTDEYRKMSPTKGGYD